MLIPVKKLRWTDGWADHAPPVEEALINPEEIVAIVPRQTKRPQPCVEITFKSGQTMVVLGQPADFLPPVTGAGTSDRRSVNLTEDVAWSDVVPKS